MFNRGIDCILILEKNVWRHKVVKPLHYLTYDFHRYLLDDKPICGEDNDDNCIVELCDDWYIVIHPYRDYSQVFDCTTHEELHKFPSCTDTSYFNGKFYYTVMGGATRCCLNLETLEVCRADEEPFAVRKESIFKAVTQRFDHTFTVINYYGHTGKLPSLSATGANYFSEVQVYDRYVLVSTNAEITVTPGDEFTLIPMQSEYGCVFEMVRIVPTL